MEEAENLYDQLAPICPILLALTASSPIFKVRNLRNRLLFNLILMFFNFNLPLKLKKKMIVNKIIESEPYNEMNIHLPVEDYDLLNKIEKPMQMLEKYFGKYEVKEIKKDSTTLVI